MIRLRPEGDDDDDDDNRKTITVFYGGGEDAPKDGAAAADDGDNVVDDDDDDDDAGASRPPPPPPPPASLHLLSSPASWAPWLAASSRCVLTKSKVTFDCFIGQVGSGRRAKQGERPSVYLLSLCICIESPKPNLFLIGRRWNYEELCRRHMVACKPKSR